MNFHKPIYGLCCPNFRICNIFSSFSHLAVPINKLNSLGLNLYHNHMWLYEFKANRILTENSLFIFKPNIFHFYQRYHILPFFHNDKLACHFYNMIKAFLYKLFLSFWLVFYFIQMNVLQIFFFNLLRLIDLCFPLVLCELFFWLKSFGRK